jgi:hypothetical protein
MSERKPISKKVRFEVFKRDSFKCQYCGKSAPDVILNVDHIKPVAAGGNNGMTNLLTSCFDCNSGKKATLLDDNTMMEKQKKQLQELNEKRLQLEMMMQWREGLMSIEEDKLNFALKKWSDVLNDTYSLNENGKKGMRKLLKKHGLNSVLDAIETSASQYLKFKDDKPIQSSVEEAWKKVERILSFNQAAEKKPYLKDLYYLRGILKNRLHYVNPHIAISLYEKAYLLGASKDSLTSFSKSVKNWTDFQFEMERFINDHEGKGDSDES